MSQKAHDDAAAYLLKHASYVQKWINNAAPLSNTKLQNAKYDLSLFKMYKPISTLPKVPIETKTCLKD